MSLFDKFLDSLAVFDYITPNVAMLTENTRTEFVIAERDWSVLAGIHGIHNEMLFEHEVFFQTDKAAADAMAKYLTWAGVTFWRKG